MSDDREQLVAILVAWRCEIDSEPFRHTIALRDFHSNGRPTGVGESDPTREEEHADDLNDLLGN